LTAAGLFNTAFDNGYEFWDLFNSVIASGWTAVTIPEVLAECGRAALDAYTEDTDAGALMHRLILDKYWGRERAESLFTKGSGPSRSLYRSVVSVPIIVSTARTVLCHPVVMARHVLGRLR
jgi:hypothetical protein